MKLLNKLYTLAIGSLLLASCEAGLVYEEVPESVYNNVELGSGFCNVSARQIFNDQIYAVNWDRWVEGYMSISTVGRYQSGADYTNNSTSSITILGQNVAPGETVNVKNTMTIVDDATAPGGKLYVLNIFADQYALYASQNTSYYFVGSKFSGDFELVNEDGTPATDPERSPWIKLPVKQTEVVVSMILADTNGACDVKRVGDSPILGAPGDFTQPRQYLLVNTTRRPDGQPAAQRLYEIRLQLLP
ncbi:hypothetical protein [Phocaeicola sp.]